MYKEARRESYLRKTVKHRFTMFLQTGNGYQEMRQVKKEIRYEEIDRAYKIAGGESDRKKSDNKGIHAELGLVILSRQPPLFRRKTRFG